MTISPVQTANVKFFIIRLENMSGVTLDKTFIQRLTNFSSYFQCCCSMYSWHMHSRSYESFAIWVIWKYLLHLYMISHTLITKRFRCKSLKLKKHAMSPLSKTRLHKTQKATVINFLLVIAERVSSKMCGR